MKLMKTKTLIVLVIGLLGCEQSDNIESSGNKNEPEHKTTVEFNKLIQRGDEYFLNTSGKKYSGKAISHNKNGRLLFEGEFLDGKKHGVFRYFHDGHSNTPQIISFETNFKNGLKNGAEYEWYSDGKKMSEIYYLDGKKMANQLHGMLMVR